MPAKYFRLPSATHGGLSLRDQGSENNGETSVIDEPGLFVVEDKVKITENFNNL